MDTKRSAIESQESQPELRTEPETYLDLEVPDEVEAWDLDDMDMMDLVPDSWE